MSQAFQKFQNFIKFQNTENTGLKQIFCFFKNSEAPKR
ncbi:hypothetical protein HPHPM2_0676 [Helicobacter pylori Hp M2]|uniref:Uncharacterized protein n=1 Tax=Helicobacter pylori Hp H-24 TaxID=992039 RepID=J0KN09_HELPX|nr:hypothetical protein HPHPH24_0709 [Helicobacter pylori Hp H-24]EJC18318.1 hypothetical protein HPHPH24B_0707 [Helicobacter pylori Hp H-24b]EJC21032.1 hypothetical protein HPHPH24C_0590 [Helicobacter pylori Hp H-24c]EJC40872.1 hypothetical protein HPHPM1_0708 [Helicobacter pylori Hp M1]EJC41992.1 hypothetical protein HPHPM2_0676 [Helicobacter pylori Hp M2]EJC44229.1 hypothetical protein HPHPM3_0708 [Helicobacter pylori Hp M3]EJC45827.1 hypothetical protein HPHPM4_0712 [Helicobacter pylori H